MGPVPEGAVICKEEIIYGSVRTSNRRKVAAVRAIAQDLWLAMNVFDKKEIKRLLECGAIGNRAEAAQLRMPASVREELIRTSEHEGRHIEADVDGKPLMPVGTFRRYWDPSIWRIGCGYDLALLTLTGRTKEEILRALQSPGKDMSDRDIKKFNRVSN